MAGNIAVPGAGGNAGPDAVSAKTANAEATAIIGVNDATLAVGGIGGTDPIFRQHAGVFGSSDQQGVLGMGHGSSATGVYGGTATGDGFGVRGETKTGVAIQGKSFGPGAAGKFMGNVEITGNLTNGGDCEIKGSMAVDGNCEIKGSLNMSSSTSDISLGDIAEDFGTQEGETIGPGTVVVLNQDGLLRSGDEAYDKRVAGVVCGAGRYRPAIILDNQPSQANRLSVALTGKVCCKVDASYSPIEVGDLLTTSPTTGYAMKVADPLRAFGSVIGKALRPLPTGQGMIPILIALQ